MLKLFVSGKPRNFQMLRTANVSGDTAVFELVETRFSAGARFEVVWECYVPPHKVKWCSQIAEKPYTVVVESGDFRILGDSGDGKGVTRHMLRVTEVNSL